MLAHCKYNIAPSRSPVEGEMAGRLTALWSVLAMFLLPLLLMGWSSIQGWRAERLIENAHVMRQWLEHPEKQLLENLPGNVSKEVTSTESIRLQFQREVRKANADSKELWVRGMLASLSFILALAALLTGPAAWIKMRLDAWRALRSQEFLYKQLASSWRTLGRWLVAHTGLLLAAVVTSLFYELSWIWSNRQDGGWAMLVFCLPAFSVLYIGGNLVLHLRQKWCVVDMPSLAFLGRPLTRTSASGAWTWIERIAEQLHAPVPDHIVVGLDQSFFVTSITVELQPNGQSLSGRTLYLPLTYLSAMSQKEVESIIGHELAHFSHRDTERSSEINARFSLMCAHLCSISGGGQPLSLVERPVVWMAGRFLYHFQLAIHHWRRAQELQADRVGAQIAGKTIFAQALLRVVALEEVIGRLLHTKYGEDLMKALDMSLRQKALGLSAETLEHSTAHPFDTHPPTAQRLQQLEVNLDYRLLARAMRVPSDTDRGWFSELLMAGQDTPVFSNLEFRNE